MRIVIFSFFIFGFSEEVAGQCRNGWIHHDQSCYHVSHDTETWIDALKLCQQFNSKLVEISTERENTFVYSLVHPLGLGTWIGGTDVMIESEWIWVTSLDSIGPDSYTHWRVNEPNNLVDDENCLEMDINGFWNDNTCHKFKQYICEMEIEPPQVIG